MVLATPLATDADAARHPWSLCGYRPQVSVCLAGSRSLSRPCAVRRSTALDRHPLAGAVADLPPGPDILLSSRAGRPRAGLVLRVWDSRTHARVRGTTRAWWGAHLRGMSRQPLSQAGRAAAARSGTAASSRCPRARRCGSATRTGPGLVNCARDAGDLAGVGDDRVLEARLPRLGRRDRCRRAGSARTCLALVIQDEMSWRLTTSKATSWMCIGWASAVVL